VISASTKAKRISTAVALPVDCFKPSLNVLFSFGNGCQPIEIVEACFDHFFQIRFEIIE
jgi:hypothetical protein